MKVPNFLQKLLMWSPLRKTPKVEERVVDLTPFLRSIEAQNLRDREKEVQRHLEEEDKKVGLIRAPISNIFMLQEFTTKNKSLVYRFMMKKMRVAIQKNLPQADLFRLGNTLQIAKINRTSFKKSLGEMIEWFTKKEEYEFAAEAKDLLTKFNINEIIEKSK